MVNWSGQSDLPSACWSQDFFPVELRANQNQHWREGRAGRGTGVAVLFQQLKSQLTGEAGRACVVLHCACV